MYQFLNYFFIVFHTLLILFNSFGYIWKKTRKWNLFTLFLTTLSWFVLGIWYGWGFCLCTEWHWQVREHLGYGYPSDSYTHFLAQLLTSHNFDQHMVDIVTAAMYGISVVLSVWLNTRDLLRKRRLAKSE